jgi:hypothetical protein
MHHVTEQAHALLLRRGSGRARPGATCEMKSLGTRLPSHSTKMRPLSSRYAPASLMYAPVSGTVGGSRTLRRRGRLPCQQPA